MKKKMIAGLVAFSCLMAEAGAEPYADEYATGEPLSLTLAESVEMALETDESIAAGEAGREAAKWGLSSARRAKGPNLGWNSQALRIGGRNYENARHAHNLYGDPHELTRKSISGYVLGDKDLPVVSTQTGTVGAYAMNNTFSNSWNLTVPIYTGGQLEGQIDTARYRLNQADLTLENTRQRVRYQAAEAYANLLHRENLAQIAKEAVDMANTQLRLISDQYSEGSVAKADVLTMQVRLANYRQNLTSAQGRSAVARSTLASVVGLPQDAALRPADVFTYEPYPKSLAECESYALGHRPDGLAANYIVKAAKSQQETAKAGYRPKITGVAGRSMAGNSPFHSERSSSWEAGIGLTWNIFDNGVTSANVNQAGALVEQYEKEAERLQKTIRLETRSAYIEMKTAEENIAAAAAAVKQAEESYVIAQVRYEEGVDILLSVTDAQEKLTQARSNYSTALYQYNLSRAALEKAMGVPVTIDAAVYAEAEARGENAAKALQAAAVGEAGAEKKHEAAAPAEKVSASMKEVAVSAEVERELAGQ